MNVDAADLSLASVGMCSVDDFRSRLAVLRIHSVHPPESRSGGSTGSETTALAPGLVRLELVVDGATQGEASFDIRELALPSDQESKNLIAGRPASTEDESQTRSLSELLWVVADFLEQHTHTLDAFGARVVRTLIGALKAMAPRVAEKARSSLPNTLFGDEPGNDGAASFRATEPLLSALAGGVTRGARLVEASRSTFERTVDEGLALGQRVAGRVVPVVRPERLRQVREWDDELKRGVGAATYQLLEKVEEKVPSILPPASQAAKALVPSLSWGILQKLRALLARAPSYAPIWLEFVGAPIQLPMLPWEDLLAPTLSSTLIRLPYHHVGRQQSRSAADAIAVICCTAPVHERALSASAACDLIVSAACNFPEVLVFADRYYHAELKRVLAQAQYTDTPIRLAEPLTQGPPEVSNNPLSSAGLQQSQESAPQDMWYMWIRRELRERPVHTVHFVAPINTAGAEPALMFSALPQGENWLEASGTHFLRATQVCALVTSLGASAVVCTAFGDETARFAWRRLSDEMVRVCPLMLALHEFRDPRRAVDDVEGIYRTLLYPHWHAKLEGVVLYSHPNAFLSTESSETVYDESRWTRGSVVRSSNTVPKRPYSRTLWAEVARRRMEQIASSWGASSAENSLEHAAQQGVLSAIQFTQEIIDDEVRILRRRAEGVD